MLIPIQLPRAVPAQNGRAPQANIPQSRLERENLKIFIARYVAGNRSALTPPTHTVEPGETLYSISVLYHTKVAELQALNGRAPADTGVKIGEVLQLPGGSK